MTSLVRSNSSRQYDKAWTSLIAASHFLSMMSNANSHHGL